MLGHLSTDICQGSLTAALAVLFAHGLLQSNMDVSLLVLASCLVSSVIQPVFGYISDLKPRPYLMMTGFITAALGIMFIGVVENFKILFMLISIMGIGCAIFHPEAGKMSNCVSPQGKKGKGMSIFSVGGNLGFALGPILVSSSTYIFGPPGILAIGIPAIISSIIFYKHNAKFEEFSKLELKRNKAQEHVKESYKGFAILTAMIFFRSSSLFGLITFTPLYFMNVFGQTAHVANINLTVIAICAAFASICGGALGDKIGFKQVQFYSSLLSIPSMLFFCLSSNWILATIMLIPVAFSVYGTLSVSMVLGQKLLCNHVGLASGITIGLGVTFGGLSSPVLGYLADNYGLDATMWGIFFCCVMTTILAFLVPDIDKIRALEQQKLNASKTEA
jgi:FSR family fosmidomycin resistance protein-like MFS transporter